MWLLLCHQTHIVEVSKFCEKIKIKKKLVSFVWFYNDLMNFKYNVFKFIFVLKCDMSKR